MADTESNTNDENIYPFISVVVPALNCVDDVDGFAKAMRNQDYPEERFEIIVVDNGSTDGTRERAQKAGMIALQRREKGRTKALNTGIEAAKGKLILTTDLSCRAEPDWIKNIVETFQRYPDAGCVAGDIKLLRTTQGAVIEFQERSNYMSPLLALGRTQLPFMPFADGANASFRREVFEEIGGFDESFVKAGDVEICYRMFVLTNYSLIFNPDALMWEPGESSLKALLYQRYRMGIGWNLMQMKYPALYGHELSANTLTLRSIWWRLNAAIRASGTLLGLNVQWLFGQNRNSAIDANIRLLMSWAQRYGRHYGKRWLAKQGIVPALIDKEKLSHFLSLASPLENRIKMTESSDNGQHT